MKNIILSIVTTSLLSATSAWAHDQSQYNLSLQDKIIIAENGALTAPQAAAVNKNADAAIKQVSEITEGVYRIAGWGIGNTIAIEAPEGWIIVDTGDYLEMAQEQRAMLEKKLGKKITVIGVLYTHSHYVHGSTAWHDENTKFYGHEDLVKNLNADMGVSVLAGNFNTRAAIQFGILHPENGKDAFPNKMGFDANKLMATKAFVAPDVTFKDGEVEVHNIAGMEVTVLPSKTDVQESVAYYFSDKKLLTSNALAAGMVFNLYTLRGDWYRNPMDFVEAADLALSYDIEYHVDIHGAAVSGKENVIAGIQETRDQMQIIHDQTFRAISLGMDAQEAAENIYMPKNIRKDKETYGQVESHVKRVYNARIGWMGWDVNDINPLARNTLSSKTIDAMGGVDKVVNKARAANATQTIEGWQWSLNLTSKLLEVENSNNEAKAIRAEAARALGQRTTSANARGFYISEALLHEGKLTFAGHTVEKYQQLSQVLGAVSAEKLMTSPINDNVQFLRFMVNPRLAEGESAKFNISFIDEKESYALALRNGIIAITSTPNKGPTLVLSKNDWSQLILGEKSFTSLNSALSGFDKAIGR